MTEQAIALSHPLAFWKSIHKVGSHGASFMAACRNAIDASSSLLFDDNFFDRFTHERQNASELKAAVDGLDRLSMTPRRKLADAAPGLYDKCYNEWCNTNTILSNPCYGLVMGLLGGVMGVTCLGCPAMMGLVMVWAVPVSQMFVRERRVIDTMRQDVADQRAEKGLELQEKEKELKAMEIELSERMQRAAGEGGDKSEGQEPPTPSIEDYGGFIMIDGLKLKKECERE